MRKYLSISFIAILLSAVACYFNSPTARAWFSEEKWEYFGKLNVVDNGRYEMVASLKFYIKKGMSKAEVIDVLGRPDEIEGNVYKYNTGYFCINCDSGDISYYILSFENGKVAGIHFLA
ncbi:hypothetical protein MED297_08356 [Reinekea sp. MED297]|uniref:Lipoprotein SmpA/OmlA domain-containing protein n=1 Tax=Reinekea blandensis MED297 TaxID=314283 RepID=A4BD04_9GAMM|nr:hypothetical protein MED297_08356 [Reinekea sp. MED297] [Reinekea blandensis MED297]